MGNEFSYVALVLNGAVESVKGTTAFGVYAASKAAIRSFVRTWTTDLKDLVPAQTSSVLVRSIRRR